MGGAILLFGLTTGLGLALLLGRRKRARRRARRRNGGGAPAAGGVRPAELTGANQYVTWAGKTWTRQEALEGLHTILDPLDRDGMEAFFRDELAGDMTAISEFMAVARWSGITGEDINVLVQEALFAVLEEDDMNRLIAESDAYWNREADEGRPV